MPIDSAAAANSPRRRPPPLLFNVRGGPSTSKIINLTMATPASCSETARPMPSLLPDGGGGGTTEGIYAMLFDMDGTLTDTDPIHHEVFSDLLMKHGKNGGVPIDDEYFRLNIAGRTNEAIFPDIWPELDEATHAKMADEKEAEFRRLTASKLSRLPGLTELLRWIDDKGIRKVAVTNAPRPNAELMLKALDLAGYFEHLVIGTECVQVRGVRRLPHGSGRGGGGGHPHGGCHDRAAEGGAGGRGGESVRDGLRRSRAHVGASTFVIPNSFFHSLVFEV